ncbi:hypothetical protein FT663_02489 [Candidozyma haemuli var. vulneris]|uniref:NAD-dependent epimerase/dehydratase domain-containing protein n=1 Tax=Candidozyma haemuli TaxID=45357 RepID=A0A2V1AXU7_9ASCO|nr:hypothetical protein CXQ85_005252 [[Candida] haemuloni]KAF3991930.1 hypothetical protein FT663_02489 [[Candida] haemuloni var. vulneris]KAF3991961.1 hypothetical protein FT662_01414 [[Candida] haemuloni var. vulneris]PVH22678.1 hypothetical protein CXQ85_005252 [[Candida] haemuloni]
MVKVLVTGASGFIAQHIVKQLIEQKYTVVGTVRSDAKGEKLVKNLSGGSFSYEIVKDISEPNAFDGVFEKHQDLDIVLHTASPFFYDTTDPENELVVPAIRGTESVFRGIQKQVQAGNKSIKRVVVTSSDAALYSADDEQNGKLTFDESSWNGITYEDAIKDPISAYYGAKTFAEKKAWEIAKETDGFPVVAAVNPVYVFGPQAFDNEAEGKLNTSNEMIRDLLKLKEGDSFSNDAGGFIDVRDVARAHLLAFQKEETAGKRLFMANGNFSVQMMLDAVHKNFPEFGSLPKGTPGSGENDISTLAVKNNEKTRQLLSFEFVPFEKVIVDVVKQIQANQKV